MDRVSFKMWAEQDLCSSRIMIKVGDDKPRVWMEWNRDYPKYENHLDKLADVESVDPKFVGSLPEIIASAEANIMKDLKQ